MASGQDSGSIPLPLTTPAGRAALLKKYKEGLCAEVLPFWMAHGADRQMGGWWTAVGKDGEVVDDDKSVWFQGRATWMFATCFNFMTDWNAKERAEWLELAKSGIKFLDEHCFDTDGRMWFTVTRDGKPLRKRRYAYSESFAAIAHAAMAKAEPEKAAYHLKRAREIFDLYCRWNFTPGLMPAKFTDVRPMIGMGPRMIAIVTAQELRLYSPAEADYYNEWIDRCIGDIRKYFAKPDLRVVMEAVTPEGEISDHFDGRILNPGHAIEGAWFLMYEGKLRGKKDYIDLGLSMLDWMWERGWDKEFGGIFYFRDVYNKPIQEYWQDMKFWWVHNEAIIATLLAYLLSGDAKYAKWHKMVHDWSYAHFPDHTGVEWYGYLHRDGTPSTPLKGSMWKGPFHLPRMQFFCTTLLQDFDKANVEDFYKLIT